MRHLIPVMDRGFQYFDESAVAGHTGITSKAVTDRAIEQLEARGQAPFFHFVQG